MVAFALALFGYAVLSLLDSSVKWLALIGLPVQQIAFVRYSIHLAAVSAIGVSAGEARCLWRSARPVLAILRGVALMAGSLCNFAALHYLPLTITSTLSFTMPMIVCLLSALFLRERIDGRQLLAVFLGSAGVLMVVQPGGAAFHPAIFLSLAAAAINAVYFMLTRILAATDGAVTQQFIAALVATVLIAPFAFTADWVWPRTVSGLVALVAAGLCGYLGHQLITLAHAHETAARLAPVAYFQLIFIAILSWLIFAEPPRPSTLFGAASICLGGWLVFNGRRSGSG